MKKLIGSVVLLAAAFLLAACGDEKKDIDINALAGELLEKVEFVDELSQVDQETAERLYNIKDAVAQSVYIGSGATAEEIAVFELKDEAAAIDAKDAALQRMKEQKESFETYIPQEVEKLDQAIVKVSGKYLIVCVSNGNTANKIIESYV